MRGPLAGSGLRTYDAVRVCRNVGKDRRGSSFWDLVLGCPGSHARDDGAWYCWYSDTRSFMLDSASVNSISSIPAALRRSGWALIFHPWHLRQCCLASAHMAQDHDSVEARNRKNIAHETGSSTSVCHKCEDAAASCQASDRRHSRGVTIPSVTCGHRCPLTLVRASLHQCTSARRPCVGTWP